MLQVDGLRRTIVLPRALVDTPTVGAKMEDGVLRIRIHLEGAHSARPNRGAPVPQAGQAQAVFDRRNRAS